MAGHLRAPSLVGREAITDAVDAALAIAGDADGSSIIVLVGEPGVGKSRLATESAARAARAGWVVLEGRGSAVAGGASLRPFAEALNGLARRHPTPPEGLGAYAAVLGRLVPEWSVQGAPEGAPHLVGEGVLRLASALGAPVLLVLEDLHWADPDSLAVLEYCADNAGSIPFLVLATTRPQAPALPAVDALARRGRAEVVTVPRLGPELAVELAACCLGVETVPPDIVDLVAAAEGLPLLVEDLLDHALVEAAAGAPPSYSELVRARLATLTEVEREVVQAAAILGSEVDAPLVARMTGHPVAKVGAWLERAADAGLLSYERGLAFRHALTRDAVLAQAGADERRDLASRAADASRDDATPDVVAGLLAVAARRDEAVTMLLEAARRERTSGTLSAATSLLIKARGLASEPALAQEVAIALVETYAAAGHADEARETAATVLPFLPVERVQQVRVRLAAAALAAQDPERARAELDAASSVGELPATERSAVWSLEAELALGGSGPDRFNEAEAWCRRAVAAAQEDSHPAAHSRALLLLGRCSRVRDLDAAERAFRSAYQVSDRAGLTVERVQALAELGTVQMMRDVRAENLEQARQAAQTVGAPMTAVGVGVNLAGVRLMRGELAAAAEMAREVRHEADRLLMPGASAAATMMEGIAVGLDGRAEEMEALLNRAVAEGGDPDVLVGSYGIGRAQVALLAEDRERAKAALAKARAVIEQQEVLMIDPASGPTAVLAALAGSATAAELDAAEHRSGVGSAWTSMWFDTARAMLGGATGDESEDLAARGLASAAKYPVFGLVAARLLAEAMVRDGWGEPVPLLRDLEVRARARGYSDLARACRGLLRLAGATPPRPRAVDAGVPETLRRLGVTAREADVLTLLRDRLTNPEIAARLVLSPRTVEKHVASLLMKTGSTGRVELAALARDPSLRAEPG